ncbi:MAG: hypothetical protein MHM6MM_005850 [Cercozoa sp. M6MM]
MWAFWAGFFVVVHSLVSATQSTDLLGYALSSLLSRVIQLRSEVEALERSYTGPPDLSWPSRDTGQSGPLGDPEMTSDVIMTGSLLFTMLATAHSAAPSAFRFHRSRGLTESNFGDTEQDPLPLVLSHFCQVGTFVLVFESNFNVALSLARLACDAYHKTGDVPETLQIGDAVLSPSWAMYSATYRRWQYRQGQVVLRNAVPPPFQAEADGAALESASQQLKEQLEMQKARQAQRETELQTQQQQLEQQQTDAVRQQEDATQSLKDRETRLQQIQRQSNAESLKFQQQQREFDAEKQRFEDEAKQQKQRGEKLTRKESRLEERERKAKAQEERLKSQERTLGEREMKLQEKTRQQEVQITQWKTQHEQSLTEQQTQLEELQARKRELDHQKQQNEAWSREHSTWKAPPTEHRAVQSKTTRAKTRSTNTDAQLQVERVDASVPGFVRDWDPDRPRLPASAVWQLCLLEEAPEHATLQETTAKCKHVPRIFVSEQKTFPSHPHAHDFWMAVPPESYPFVDTSRLCLRVTDIADSSTWLLRVNATSLENTEERLRERLVAHHNKRRRKRNTDMWKRQSEISQAALQEQVVIHFLHTTPAHLRDHAVSEKDPSSPAETKTTHVLLRGFLQGLPLLTSSLNGGEVMRYPLYVGGTDWHFEHDFLFSGTGSKKLILPLNEFACSRTNNYDVYIGFGSATAPQNIRSGIVKAEFSLEEEAVLLPLERMPEDTEVVQITLLLRLRNTPFSTGIIDMRMDPLLDLFPCTPTEKCKAQFKLSRHLRMRAVNCGNRRLYR